ncbi:hypothetical protein [Streptomyces somaliensis]|uniref:hypothetical protein n=1 Tax=Streptomyces somaliensis TaxID=78355 RepID=UPI0034E95B26
MALWHPGPPGDPHGREPDPRLLRIGPDEVPPHCCRTWGRPAPGRPNAPCALRRDDRPGRCAVARRPS